MSRRKAREEAFKSLYAEEVGGRYQPEDSTGFARQLVDGVQAHQDELDLDLENHLTDWRMDRVYPVERVLLRMGLYEIAHTETSKAVVINEAVELAKEYGDQGTGAFVNGILDNFEKPMVGETLDE